MQLAKRLSVVQASEIREILKVTSRPEVISFAGGLPAPELFPTRSLAEIASELICKEGERVLQYSTTEGDPDLRASIAARMNRKWGTTLRSDEVLITTGSQQALDLVGKLLLDEQDAVLCESPTYLGALSAWNVFQPRWVEVPTDDEGMIPDELERVLNDTRRVKLAYAIPNFQNPTGRTWTAERRKRVVELLEAFAVPLVEDNPYGEVRFEGSDQKAMQAQQGKGAVLSLGTFSKVLCPGLRVGWIAGPRALLDKLVILKQGADLHTSTLDQRLIAEFLKRNGLEENIERIAQVYRSRRDAMLDALGRYMPVGTTWTHPAGGLFLWVEFPSGIEARELLRCCLDKNVAFVPGGAFFPNGGHENTARLNFSNMPEERIAEGIRRMAEALECLLRGAIGSPSAKSEVSSMQLG